MVVTGRPGATGPAPIIPPMPPSDEPRPYGPGRRQPPAGLRRAPASGDVVPSRKRRAEPEDELDENPSMEDIERFGDVTRTCPECGKDVFDDAAVCYHCGHAFERTTAGSTPSKGWVVAVVVVLVGVMVLGAVGGLFRFW